jgi:hypothetical protein
LCQIAQVWFQWLSSFCHEPKAEESVDTKAMLLFYIAQKKKGYNMLHVLKILLRYANIG